MWKATHTPRHAVGSTCTTGNCNPKAGGPTDPKDHPIIIDRPIDTVHRDDIVHLADSEHMGHPSHTHKIREHVHHHQHEHAKDHPGVHHVKHHDIRRI